MENEVQEEPLVKRPERHHRKPEVARDKLFYLRQVLNILFMLIAVAGCVVYLKVNDTMGAIILVIAVSFKMAECALRMFKKQ